MKRVRRKKGRDSQKTYFIENNQNNSILRHDDQHSFFLIKKYESTFFSIFNEPKKNYFNNFFF